MSETKVVIESLGNQDFYEVRDILLEEGKKFGEEALAQVKYSQLVNCALGGLAGATVCSLNKIREEKQRRRARFLSLDLTSLQDCEEFLRLHKMYEDVRYALVMKDAPLWESLSYRARSWAKISCLSTHSDYPIPRLTEARLLLQKAMDPELEKFPLPEAVATLYMQKIENIAKLEGEDFRTQLARLGDDLIRSFTTKEHEALARNLISNFSCTSDCFRVLA